MVEAIIRDTLTHIPIEICNMIFQYTIEQVGRVDQYGVPCYTYNGEIVKHEDSGTMGIIDNAVYICYLRGSYVVYCVPWTFYMPHYIPWAARFVKKINLPYGAYFISVANNKLVCGCRKQVIVYDIFNFKLILRHTLTHTLKTKLLYADDKYIIMRSNTRVNLLIYNHQLEQINNIRLYDIPKKIWPINSQLSYGPAPWAEWRSIGL